MKLTRTDRAPDDTEAVPSTARGTAAFLSEVVKRFARVEAAESVNRREAVDDLKFRAGEQWPEDIKASRTIDKRPCLTINKVNTFVHQITNEQRQNRPSIKVSPVGDKGDVETAKMLMGIIRQIERQSHADVAYDTGFESAVTIGWGYWRVITEYENDKSFNQVVRIERIRNPFRVYLDPDRQSPVGADAQWGFITDMVAREDFNREWPKADPVEWQEHALGDEDKWSTLTHVRVAEYFQFENRERRLLALASGHIGYYDELNAQIRAQVDAGTMPVVNERKVDAKHVVWYKLTAHEVLEERAWPGKWIPIIECRGNEYDIEGEITLMGLVRAMKDPQRMYNFWCTSETEEVALRPKAPWIIEQGQIEGYERQWRDANTKSLPYLIYKNSNIQGKPTPVPQRQQFQGVPAAVVQAKIGAAQDMQAVTGVRWDATMNERMHDESGRALRELKRVGDIGNFHYVDNLARSLRHTGAVLIDLIPKIYDTKRILTILREDDSEEQVTLDPMLQGAHEQREGPDGKVMRLFNPGVGEYEVVVTIGPNFQTKRQEAADSMLQFMQAVPNAAPLIADLIAKNMDWPGAEEIYARLQSMLPPQMLEEKLKNLPPEAKGIIGSLTQQLSQLKQQHDQAVAMLGDKDKDRAVDIEKISKDFEAKQNATLAKFIADMEKLRAETDASNPESQMAKVQADLVAKLAGIEAKATADREKLQAEIMAAREETAIERDRLAVEARARERESQIKARDGAGKLMLQKQKQDGDQQLAREQMRADEMMGDKDRAAATRTADKDRAAAKGEEKPKKGKKTKITLTGPSGRKYVAEREEVD